MKSTLLVLVLCCLPGAALFADVTATGVDGATIRLQEPAKRIISLSPHLTELLYTAGAGDRIVGAVAYSDHPPAARNLPRVGDAFRLDLERIVALRPDLVVAWESGNARDAVERLRGGLGIAVLVTEVRALEDIARQLETLGRLAGTPETAGRAAKGFRDRIALLRREYGAGKPVRVFYQATARPLYTVGGNHVITEIIELCGGRNVFAEQETLAPSVSIEAVLAAVPEVIIAGAGEAEPDPLATWRKHDSLTAVQRGHLCQVPADLVHRSTTRIADGARRVCECLDKARR